MPFAFQNQQNGYQSKRSMTRKHVPFWKAKEIASTIFDSSILAVSGHSCWYFGLVHRLVVQDDNDDTNTPARLTLAPR